MKLLFVQAAARRLHLLGFGAAIAVLAIIGFLSARAARDEADALVWVEHTHQVIDQLRRVSTELSQAESDLRGAALSHNLDMLASFDDSLSSAAEAMGQVRVLTADNPAQQNRFDELAPAFERRVALLRAHRESLQHDGTFAVLPEAVRLSAAIRSTVASMVRAEQFLLGERTTAAQQQAARANLSFLGGLIWSTLLAGAALAFLRRYLRQRRSAEGALASEHQLLSSIIEGTADSVYVKDLDGRYVMLNTASARALSSTPAQVLGKTDFDIFPEAIATALRGKDTDIIVGGARSYEQHIVIAGSPRTYSVTKAPVRDSENRVTGLVGIARDVTEQKESSDRRLTHLKLMLQLSEMLQACRSSEEAYDVIGHMAPHFARGSSGAMYLYHPSRNIVEARSSWGGLPTHADAALFAPEDCWALRRGHAHLYSETELALPCKHVSGASSPTTLCVPLLADGVVMGLFHLRLPGSLTEDVQQQATLFVGQIGITLSSLALRETLRNQSIRDPLTGLFNRRYTEETLNRELSRAARDKAPLSVLAIDVDHFKRFNDNFGHAAGDLVLRELANLLQTRTRGSDVASRMGGEELLVILPGADRKQAVEKADRLRAEIAQLSVTHLGKPLGPVTISVGTAQFPEHGTSADELTRAADGALYRAKSGGRNCVVSAE